MPLYNNHPLPTCCVIKLTRVKKNSTDLRHFSVRLYFLTLYLCNLSIVLCDHDIWREHHNKNTILGFRIVALQTTGLNPEPLCNVVSLFIVLHIYSFITYVILYCMAL